MMNLKAVVLALLSLLAASPLLASDVERKAVEEAVRDYVDALYLLQPERVDRSVHPELAKRGFMSSKTAPGYRESKMTFAQLRDLATSWNKNGRVNPATGVREITVFEVLDQIATAKLVAHWGVDYFHLAKYDGKWKIVNVMWQAPPKR